MNLVQVGSKVLGTPVFSNMARALPKASGFGPSVRGERNCHKLWSTGPGVGSGQSYAFGVGHIWPWAPGCSRRPGPGQGGTPRAAPSRAGHSDERPVGKRRFHKGFRVFRPDVDDRLEENRRRRRKTERRKAPVASHGWVTQ